MSRYFPFQCCLHILLEEISQLEYKEKKEDIWLSPMTKAPITTEMSNGHKESLINFDISVFIRSRFRFNLTYRYIDDILSINNQEFEHYLGQMYPAELEIKDTTESTTSASYLDLLLSIGRDGQLHTSIYDKRDDFNWRQRMAFLSLNLYDTPGLAPRMNVLFWGPGYFPVSYSNRDTSWNAWNHHSGSFMVDTGVLFSNMKYPPHEFHDLDTELDLHRLWVVSMEHLQRVWHASIPGNAYPSGHLVPSHHCGTCLCSNCWDQIPRTCHVFTRLFTSNTPWYILDFVLTQYNIRIPFLKLDSTEIIAG